jgi:hypothetical protein
VCDHAISGDLEDSERDKRSEDPQQRLGEHRARCSEFVYADRSLRLDLVSDLEIRDQPQHPRHLKAAHEKI